MSFIARKGNGTICRRTSQSKSCGRHQGTGEWRFCKVSCCVNCPILRHFLPLPTYTLSHRFPVFYGLPLFTIKNLNNLHLCIAVCMFYITVIIIITNYKLTLSLSLSLIAPTKKCRWQADERIMPVTQRSMMKY